MSIGNDPFEIESSDLTFVPEASDMSDELEAASWDINEDIDSEFDDSVDVESDVDEMFDDTDETTGELASEPDTDESQDGLEVIEVDVDSLPVDPTEPDVELVPPQPERSETLEQVALRARENTMACKLLRRMFTFTRKLSSSQVSRVASTFNAQQRSVSASKKLIDSKTPEVARVQAIMSQAYNYWKDATTPYPENGVRLLRRDRLDSFVEKMTAFRAELGDALLALDSMYQQVIDKARNDLGELFNISDYPPNLSGSYEIEWEFPEVEPPNWMKVAHPELYRQQMEILSRRFEAAVEETEQVFADEFAKVVEHLSSRLGKDEETGEFHSVSKNNLKSVQEFISRFNELNLGGNQSLADLVARASQLVEGADVTKIRKDADFRNTLQQSMAKLREDMNGVIVSGTRQISLTDDE